MGRSGRAMIQGRIAGESDPAKLAALAHPKVRAPQASLREALHGRVKCNSLNLIWSGCWFPKGAGGRGAVLTLSWDRDPPFGGRRSPDDARAKDYSGEGRIAGARQAARQC